MNTLHRKISARFIRFVALVSVVSVFAGCSTEKESMIRDKLEIICKDDMATIADDIVVEQRMDPVYYTIVVFKKYSDGKYTYMAVVDFFFMKNVQAKIVRKYRYYAPTRQWDRYFNEYRFLNAADTADSNRQNH